jgi:hypothetical protein
MGNPKPSFFRVIQTDFIALAGVLVPAVFLVMYISIAYFGYFPGFRGHDPIQGTEGAPFFFYAFIVTAVVGIPLTAGRFRSIQNLFLNGAVVIGKVEGVYFHRDRGSIDVRYEYNGKSYLKANPIMKTARTKSLAPGMEVALVVNKDDPNRALIRDLYT